MIVDEELFKKEVHDMADEIDPDNSLDWYSLTIGWAIAKGMTPDEAENFACVIRYETDLG
jgi:hypothetical protein